MRPASQHRAERAPCASSKEPLSKEHHRHRSLPTSTSFDGEDEVSGGGGGEARRAYFFVGAGEASTQACSELFPHGCAAALCI
jgi:hypothetical protein